MNVIRHTDKAFTATIRALPTQSSLFDPTIEERTRAILLDVYTRGDAALLELTERFDGAKLTADQLAVTKAELVAASERADETVEGVRPGRIGPPGICLEEAVPLLVGRESGP